MSQGQKVKSAISPTREENYPEWYQQVIKVSNIAENSPVRGCMVIKPWGYALWENIQKILDQQFKSTGHENAYFPLFIPLSFFQKEAKHVDGFATECAVVTHHRLEKNEKGELVPASPLEEPLVVRPTSEMIIGEMFSKWVQSYRDLPILINQWANVVRWEMRTRMFLRTSEFLWQEGHTVHATKEEAMEETLKMLDLYHKFCHEYLAIPVIKGEKSENERFPGADHTFTIEAMMQDRKALQSGTSHFLGQNFSKAASIKYQTKEGQEEYAWTTSWGVTTRLIGGMIMCHSDDDGLILPPRISHTHVVIIPIVHSEDKKEEVFAFCDDIQRSLAKKSYFNQPIIAKVDKRDERGGEKIWHWIKKGVPIRIEIGLKEIQENKVCVAMRSKGHKDKLFVSVAEFYEKIDTYLDEIQTAIYQKALAHLKAHTHFFDSKEAILQFFKPKNAENPEIHGGFAKTFWAGDTALEEELKKEHNITIRCLPLDEPHREGICPFTNKKTSKIVIFAKSY
jgi:prolyl-tRNA synthetase